MHAENRVVHQLQDQACCVGKGRTSALVASKPSSTERAENASSVLPVPSCPWKPRPAHTEALTCLLVEEAACRSLQAFPCCMYHAATGKAQHRAQPAEPC